ncbi:MAG: zinc-binding dehydrogenase, partial [Candidatus Eremiobacteraeota bacterium]|nr:zinc-binding dehydrogenase [Candidatus Eremiobacteraeota bacterium]
DPVEAKRKKALELGATAALDPSAGDVVAQILELTGGAGVDYAFEVSGVARAFEQAAASICAGGMMVAVGIPRRSDQAQISPAMLVLRDRTIRGAFMSSAVPRRDIPRYVALWKAGKLPVEKLVSGSVGLESVNEAMDALAAGESLRTIVAPHVMAAR